MAEVFAGLICGYAIALLSTPLLALSVVRLRAGSELLARLLPPGTSLVSIGVVLHWALFLFWTAVGMLLGLVLLAMEDAGAAAGSRNAAFTLFVAAAVAAVIAPPVVVFARARRVVLSFGAFVIAVFGWLMPYMVEWSRFE